MIRILVPRTESIYKIASDELSAFWQKITGKKISVVTEDDGKSDLIVLGSDAVNSFTHRMIIEKTVTDFQLRTGSDEFCLRSSVKGKRRFLFIAGARPRALLYGVYYFLEHHGNCRFFWDGDIVPRQKDLEISGIDVCRTPRFEYRGLRYFAHRSLNRFQAEHWGWEEWKKEIDWIVKKRLNTFMLRIGLDDLFQKAFPDIVKYPGYSVPESTARSYDDRDLFWSLEYRGELRKKIIAYARERDLIHPEDVGTMTHWYSRTPLDFLEKVKPEFIPQTSTAYRQETGLVWDIRDDKNLDNYFKLTETSIKEHGEPELFHTIGLAERRCYEDPEASHQMKLYTYRRIISKLREKYPHTPLLVGSWDFSMYWSCDQVKELLAQLDPRNTFIFDYTSDNSDEVNNFTNWGIVDRFPWFFGIFHAYEPSNGLMGQYDRIARRLPIAAADPMCKGFFFWPECSHSDTLMLEFFAAMAWDPDNCRIEDFLPVFCRNRYGEKWEEMLKIWQLAIGPVKLCGWQGAQEKHKLAGMFADVLFALLHGAGFVSSEPASLGMHDRQLRHMAPEMPKIPGLLKALVPMIKGADEFLFRDIIDLARMAVSRFQGYGFSKLALLMESWRNGRIKGNVVTDLLKQLCLSAELEFKLVSAHKDFSMYGSLQALREKHETNPDFEKTLKANGENHYCRSCIAEFFPMIYLPQLEFYAGWVTEKIRSNDKSPWVRPACFDDALKEIQEYFYSESLENFAPDHAKAAKELSRTLEKLALCAEKTVRENEK